MQESNQLIRIKLPPSGFLENIGSCSQFPGGQMLPSSADAHDLTTFCRPFVNWLCYVMVHFILNSCLYFVCYGWSVHALTVLAGFMDVTRLDGARNMLCAPMLEPELFRKQMYCIEESTCDIAGTFRRPLQWFGCPILIRRPGKCAPLTPPLIPWLDYYQLCDLLIDWLIVSCDSANKQKQYKKPLRSK